MNQIATSPRPSAREIGGGGMMMSYTDPQIIAEQIAALKFLGLIEAAMPSIEAHNPVLAAAISSGREAFISYEQMREEPVEYRYEGSNGEGFIGQTETWVAYLHYELQTVALYSLMDTLEAGELHQDQISSYSVALGDTSPRQSAYLAFNYNSDRQPHEFFDGIKTRLRNEGFGKMPKGYDSFYRVPTFLWGALNAEQRGRVAAEILRGNFNLRFMDFEDRVLGREFGNIMSSIFAWNDKLNSPALVEGRSERILFDYGDRFSQGRIELNEEGFLWVEELSGLTKALPIQ